MARNKSTKPPSPPISPPSSLSSSPSSPHHHRRAPSTQNPTISLIASDPHNTAQPPAPKHEDTEQAAADEEEGLRFMGYRGGEEWYRESEAGKKMVFCVCESEVEGGEELDVEREGLVRCSGRDCDPGWFHLSCINLPDHPPMRLGWMCPDCISAHGIVFQVQGLWDLKKDGNEALDYAKEWLGEMWEEVKEEQRRRNRRRVLRGLMEE